MPTVKEIKDARKTIRFIKKNFGDLGTPYKIIFDAEMIGTIARRKVPWKKQLDELLQGKPFIPMITEATVKYLRGYGDSFIEAVVMAKHMERPRKSKYSTSHKRKERTEKTTMDDVYRSIFECIGKDNDRKYMLAVNDKGLRDHIAREYPMIPLLKLVHSGLRMQKPTGEMQREAKKKLREKLNEYSQLSPWERKMLKELKKHQNDDEEEDDNNNVQAADNQSDVESEEEDQGDHSEEESGSVISDEESDEEEESYGESGENLDDDIDDDDDDDNDDDNDVDQESENAIRHVKKKQRRH